MRTTGRCYCGSLKYEINGQAEAALMSLPRMSVYYRRQSEYCYGFC